MGIGSGSRLGLDCGGPGDLPFHGRGDDSDARRPVHSRSKGIWSEERTRRARGKTSISIQPGEENRRNVHPALEMERGGTSAPRPRALLPPVPVRPPRPAAGFWGLGCRNAGSRPGAATSRARCGTLERPRTRAFPGGPTLPPNPRGETLAWGPLRAVGRHPDGRAFTPKTPMTPGSVFQEGPGIPQAADHGRAPSSRRRSGPMDRAGGPIEFAGVEFHRRGPDRPRRAMRGARRIPLDPRRGLSGGSCGARTA